MEAATVILVLNTLCYHAPDLSKARTQYICNTALVHCIENPIYVFLFWELRNLSPNFHIHVSVSALYIPRIGSHIFLQQNRQIDCGNIQIADRHMNVPVVAQFLFWEYLFEFSVLVLCSVSFCRLDSKRKKTHKYRKDAS
jgi:hypothetical protein